MFVGTHIDPKGQLPEKELRIYELELRVKDLKAEVRDLGDAKEKLQTANRNARILEEENNNLHLELKGASFTRESGEAVKLIKENEDLRRQIEKNQISLEAHNEDLRAFKQSSEKQLWDISAERERIFKEKERLSKELESARRQCVDLQRSLEEQKDIARNAKELWEQEIEGYSHKMEEQHVIIKRFEGMPSAKESRGKERGTASSLQEMLLKEEVQELEKKLKDAQERIRGKEKQWRQTETDMKNEIATLKSNKSLDFKNDQGLFRSMQSQIADLKEEIAFLQNEKRTALSFPILNIDDNESIMDPDTRSVRSVATTRTATAPGAASFKTGISDEMFNQLSQQYNRAIKECDALRDDLDKYKSERLQLQNVNEEKDIRCKELEALLAAAKKSASSSPTPAAFYQASNRSALAVSKDVKPEHRHEDVSSLKRKVRDLQSEASNLLALKEQGDTINTIRVKELQSQIDELLAENADLRQRMGDTQAIMHEAVIAADDFDCVPRLTKERRESIEDVMRLLEDAWTSDDDAKRQLRKVKYQGAAMANHDAMRDDEIRRLQRALADADGRLHAAQKDAEERLRAAQKDAADRLRAVEKDAGALSGLKHDLREREKELNDLKKRIRPAEAQRDDMKHELRDQANEIESLKRKLRDHDGDKDKQEKMADESNQMRRRMEEIQKDNERLRRQNAMFRDSPRGSTATRTAVMRSPRVSARRATPEMSQLSVRSSDERKRNAMPEGAHLAVTVVELCDVFRNGRPITEPGYIIIKLKSIKEKYKTSVKELASVIRFDETFVFYLAQPDQDVITLHVFYKAKSGSKECHIGDACFSMATLHRGVARQRIAPVVQEPGTKEGKRSAQVEVFLQTDDFGKMTVPTPEEIEDENLRFKELVGTFQASAPEKLHAADVYMASTQF